MNTADNNLYSVYWDYFHENFESKLPNLVDLNLLNFIPQDHNILEIGFGHGKNLLALEKHGHQNLFGIDISKNAIELLKRQSSKITVELNNGHDIPFDDDFFDKILLFGVFSSISNCKIRNRLINDMKRVIKKGGVIIFVDYIFDVSKKELYDKFYEKYNFYGKFKTCWSKIPFVHYKIEHLKSIFDSFVFDKEEHISLKSCVGNTDPGVLLLMRFN